MRAIRVGTRSSMLAEAQAQGVADALSAAHAGLAVELAPMVTSGDRHSGLLAAAGGKGLFVTEIEQALLAGRIDLAVHSAKDVPSRMCDGLVIAAAMRRANAADALVSPAGGGIESLPAGATVATGSGRRAAQLLAARDDLVIVPIRGNVETRLRKVLGGGDDPDRPAATVLAVAGLVRSGLMKEHRRYIHPLSPESFIPAAGQGTLLVQSVTGNTEARELAAAVGDGESLESLQAERAVLVRLGADCHSCVGVYIHAEQGRWRAHGMAARTDGTGLICLAVAGGSADQVGQALATGLLEAGAAELLGG